MRPVKFNRVDSCDADGAAIHSLPFPDTISMPMEPGRRRVTMKFLAPRVDDLSDVWRHVGPGRRLAFMQGTKRVRTAAMRERTMGFGNRTEGCYVQLTAELVDEPSAGLLQRLRRLVGG